MRAVYVKKMQRYSYALAQSAREELATLRIIGTSRCINNEYTFLELGIIVL